MAASYFPVRLPKQGCLLSPKSVEGFTPQRCTPVPKHQSTRRYYAAWSYLYVLEGLLRSGVEPLGVLVDGGDVVVVLDDGVDVLVKLALHEPRHAAGGLLQVDGHLIVGVFRIVQERPRQSFGPSTDD